jgi:hypothetical protein
MSLLVIVLLSVERMVPIHFVNLAFCQPQLIGQFTREQFSDDSYASN